nr:IS66 family transposase zinc-finger binding domain-containing protein [Halomonas sp. Ps84H-12]
MHGLPARIEVTRHVRRKYACPTCEEGMKTAPAPPAKLFCLKAMPAPRCSPLYRDRQIPGRALP